MKITFRTSELLLVAPDIFNESKVTLESVDSSK
jgi:hypothetical protein